MEGYLKVTPEELMRASGEFAEVGGTIANLTTEMTAIVNELKGIWQGEASDAYSSKFMGLSDDMERINRMINEHVNDLNEMAHTYQLAEDESREESARLLADVVE